MRNPWRKRNPLSSICLAGRSWFRRLALALLVFVTTVLAAFPAFARAWRFDVVADGIRVGTYEIAVAESGDTSVVTSDMKVGVLGIGAYRQHAEETWKAGCLTSMATRTEERGQVTAVAGQQEGSVFRIDGVTSAQLPGCVMSFAYWNPNVLKQSQLVNVQTGTWTPVNIQALGNETIDVGGRPVRTVHHSIETEKNTIEVWYTLEGEWVSLKTTTKSGGHVLAYRPRSIVP